MNRMSKQLLFVLMTIMAYLPMTVVYAVPDVSIAPQSQSVMTMTDMDMADCHHQKTEINCEHCANQHSCNCSHSACSTSIGLTHQSAELNALNHTENSYSVMQLSALFQQSTLLFRPPISL